MNNSSHVIPVDKLAPMIEQYVNDVESSQQVIITCDVEVFMYIVKLHGHFEVLEIFLSDLFFTFKNKYIHCFRLFFD